MTSIYFSGVEVWDFDNGQIRIDDLTSQEISLTVKKTKLKSIKEAALFLLWRLSSLAKFIILRRKAIWLKPLQII